MTSCHKAVFVHDTASIITSDVQLGYTAFFQHVFLKTYMFLLDLVDFNGKIQICLFYHSLNNSSVFQICAFHRFSLQNQGILRRVSQCPVPVPHLHIQHQLIF